MISSRDSGQQQQQQPPDSFSSCWRWHRGKHLFLEANWKTKGWTFLLFCCCLYTYSLWQNMEFCLDLNWKIKLILMLLQFATIEFARFFFMKCCRSEKKMLRVPNFYSYGGDRDRPPVIFCDSAAQCIYDPS